MQEIVKNKMVLIVAAFLALNVCIFFGGNIIVNRAADKVMERLQKDYSPSPYGPGIDPDRVNPLAKPQPQPQPSAPQMAKTDNSKSYMELRQAVGGQQEEIKFAPSLKNITQDSVTWRNDWEKERGFPAVQY